jgi:hypothetical protein
MQYYELSDRAGQVAAQSCKALLLVIIVPAKYQHELHTEMKPSRAALA